MTSVKSKQSVIVKYFRGWALEELKPLKKDPFKDLLVYSSPRN